MGYQQHAGGGWTGDVLIADWEELDNASHVSEVYIRRINSQEMFPVREEEGQATSDQRMKRGLAVRRSSAERKQRRRKGQKKRPRKRLLARQKIFPPRNWTSGHATKTALSVIIVNQGQHFTHQLRRTHHYL